MNESVVLTWVDGSKERLLVSMARVTDGVLVLCVGRGEYRHIPLAQLREWRTEP